MINAPQKFLSMKVVSPPKDIVDSLGQTSSAVLNNNELPAGAHQGVMLCKEIQEGEGNWGEFNNGNTLLQSGNSFDFQWLVLVPKYLSESCGVSGGELPSDEKVTPPYTKGEIIYCALLDLPVVMQKSIDGFGNTHPKVVGGTPGWPNMIHTPSVRRHYGGANINPATQMIFWVDLNIDGRTRSGASVSGSGTAQNVWL